LCALSLEKCLTSLVKVTRARAGSLLGQGSFATVHKGVALADGAEVALKIVRPESDMDFGSVRVRPPATLLGAAAGRGRAGL